MLRVMHQKKSKRPRTTDDLTPGTPAGNEYLNRMDAERRRRGYHGRTLPGKRDTASGYGSKAHQRAQKRSK